MASIQTDVSLLDEVLDFLAENPTHQQIIDLRPSPAVQARISELLEKNRHGTLSQDENEELDEIMQVDQFMTLLKARVRKKMAEL